MSITVANLVAQIGADATQFKIIMNEVDARLNLTNIKAQKTSDKITSLKGRAAEAQIAADTLRTKRVNLQAMSHNAREMVDVKGATAEREAALQYLNDQKAVVKALHDKAARATAAGQTSMATTIKKQAQVAEKDAKEAQIYVDRANSTLKGLQDRSLQLYEREMKLRKMVPELQAKALSTQTEEGAMQEVARQYAARMKQNANERKFRAANGVASIAGNLGLASAGGLAVATKSGADYNQMMATTAHNTSLSTAGVQIMNQAVAKLGAESGASMEGLAGGFREIENRGYSAAQAIQILTPAMQAAVAKGSDLADTTRLLTNIMKEFGIPVERSADAMGVLVETSRRSGTEMSQLVDVFGTMSAYSANLGVSLAETSTAYIVLTRHGLDAHQAATQFRNDINKIINPSKQVIGVLKDLQKHTGVPLLKDFSGAGLRANGLLGTMNEVHKAADLYKGGVPRADIVTKLFPLQRGQLGASILTGTGFNETAGVLKEVNAAEHGGVELSRLYKESLGQLNQQFDRLKNAAILTASAVATALTPAITNGTTWLNNMVTSFNTLDQQFKSGAVEAVAFASGLLITTAVVGKLIVGVVSLNTALQELGVAKGIMGLVTSFGPVGIAIAALAAAGYGLYHVTNEMAMADQRATEQTRARSDALQLATRSHYENGEQVTSLVQEYGHLAGQTHRTTEQTSHMQDVLDKISQMAPDLVTGFNQGGHAISLVGNAAGIAAMQLYNMGVQARVARGAVLDLQAAQALAKVNTLKDQQRTLDQQLGTGTVNITGQRERDTRGINLGGQWRPATPQEISSKAPGLKKVGGEDFLNLLPGHHGILPGPTSYFVPQREKNDNGTDKIFGNVSPEMRALAEQKRRVDADAAAAQREHDDLIKQANNAMFGKDDPLARPKQPAFPQPDRGDGVDHTAGLGAKEKKDKKSDAEKEAERLKDKYLQFIESQRESIFMTANSGQFGEQAEHAKAMWETMSHGAVEYLGHVEHLKGDFAGLKAVYRENAVAEATAAEKRKIAFEQDKKWLELQKANALAAFTAEKNADRTAKTPAQIAAFKLAQGGYREYGSHAGAAAKSDADTQTKAQLAEVDERIKKLKTDITEPAKGERSVMEQTIAGIVADPEMYKRLGKEATFAFGVIAQVSHNAGEATKLYDNEVDKAKNALAELHKEDDGTKSRAAIFALELQDKKYKNLSESRKEALIAIYKEADATEKLNNQNKALKTLKDYLHEQVTDTNNTLAGATIGGAGERAIDFHQKAHDKIGEQWKKMDAGQQASADQDIEVTFQQVESKDKQIKAARRLSDSLEEVKQKTLELTRVNKVNIDGVNISVEEWNKLTDTQKKTVDQFKQLYTVRTTIGDVMQGIDDLFTKTLDNIKDHGFRSFFRDILKGFDDMLFGIANKWASSQFAQLVNGGIDSALSGLFGVKGGAHTNGTPGITGGGGSSGGGGILGSLMGSVFGALAGGHGGGGSMMPGVDMSQTSVSNSDMYGAPTVGAGIAGIASIFGGMMADGGTTRAGMAYIVGDGGGPEMFIPGRSGTIIPHDVIKGGVGGGDIHVHLHGITDANSFQVSRHQVFQGLQRAIIQTQRR